MKQWYVEDNKPKVYDTDLPLPDHLKEECIEWLSKEYSENILTDREREQLQGVLDRSDYPTVYIEIVFDKYSLTDTLYYYMRTGSGEIYKAQAQTFLHSSQFTRMIHKLYLPKELGLTQ